MKLCVYCKRMHSSESCPLWLKAQTLANIKNVTFKQTFAGSATTPFIGHYGYPNVNVGILSPPEIREDSWLLDAPKEWAVRGYGIGDVAMLRSALLNARQRHHIKATEKIIDIGREIAMARTNVEVEFSLKDTPQFRLNTDSYTAPTGPRALLEKATLLSNPSVDTHIEKTAGDTELKATDAVNYLYKHGFDENKLTRLLSMGALGIGSNRKLVPTRWAITATDDMLGKELLRKIRECETINDYKFYYGQYLGNHYLQLALPELWGYELYELPTEQKETAINETAINYTTDYESYKGRKDYAQETAGGYYTARLAIAEHLTREKRQAAILTLRFITNEYTLPLGVWVTREASRNSFREKPMTFASKELLLNYVKEFAKIKFGIDLTQILRKSKLLATIKQQKKLMEFG